jgi:hypothetical protein
MHDDPAPPQIELGGYDFVDFGCSEGGSIRWCMQRFAAQRGIGVDIRPAKVEAAHAAGYDAVVADATRPELFAGRVRFAAMVHFLEHLPSIDAARQAVSTGLSISRDFLYIRQPWFDSDGELLRRGLKLYWSDWLGHPLPMTSLQAFALMRGMTRRGLCVRFCLYGRRVVTSTADPAVVPLDAPVDSHAYDPGPHGPKPDKPLTGVFTDLVVLAARSDPAAIEDARAGDKLHLLYDSAG